MIDYQDFQQTVVDVLHRDIRKESDLGQSAAIRAPINQSLFVIAGPGSGKTSMITLRVLKLILVDNVSAATILVTTFTNKAASELRSRILGWGDIMRRAFLQQSKYKEVGKQLHDLDFNQVITGTIDSIAEEILSENRQPGSPRPAVVEDFISSAIMVRVGLFGHGRFKNNDLTKYVTGIRGSAFGLSLAEKSSVLRDLKDRIQHDRVDIDKLTKKTKHKGLVVACEAIRDYDDTLRNLELRDFTGLEQEFESQLSAGNLEQFLDQLNHVMVDEYQDTNLLQQRIYFHLARGALQKGGSIAVVGDDDQSLYRFRGATVDLFESFDESAHDDLKTSPMKIYLTNNYRSTHSIVDWVNNFVGLDPKYQIARISAKPRIVGARPTVPSYVNYPVLGMFRSDIGKLSADLSEFIHRVVAGPGFSFSHKGTKYSIRIDSEHGGSSADVCLLCSSPEELSSNDNPRLPLLLRNRLDQMNPPIRTFNPRGQELSRIPSVMLLCGLLLECMDPKGSVQASLPTLGGYVLNTFDQWRISARSYVKSDPDPRKPISLRKFVHHWQKRTPLISGNKRWEVPIAQLAYTLLTWIPMMQNDIEALVHLEAVLRTITESGSFSKNEGNFRLDSKSQDSSYESVKDALWHTFMPLASGAIEVNEDLYDTLAPDRFNIMSIHQAKGLEFPLVIVDVGSEFKSAHPAQAFKRFPRKPSKDCEMEDDLRPFSPLGKPKRAGLDRTFDDLVRRYFVAFSRAQDVLLLVGLDSSTSVESPVQNVATGWSRANKWVWKGLKNLVSI